MHQHYHTIRQLQAALANHLLHAALTGAFTLSKDELLLLFNKSGATLTIRMVIESGHCFLLFGHDAIKKVSNAQAVFDEVKQQIIIAINMHGQNRSFEMVFANGFTLVFKLYDGLANVLLYDEAKNQTDIFRDAIQNDLQLSYESFLNPIILLSEGSVNDGYFCICKTNDTRLPYRLFLTPTDNKLYESSDVMDALTQFARLNLAHLHFTKQKSSVMQIIKAQLKRTEALIHKTELQLQLEQETLSPEQKGHLIMANLHVLKTGMDKATLHDFYHNQAVEIKLKKELSPQENAAYYYRKNRNKKIETVRLQEKLSNAHARLVLLQTNLTEASRAADIKSLKPYLKEQKQKEDVLPFKVFMCEGFTIWVGKNAVNNDLLTTRYAHKNDLWLHVKDVAGSHVVIKQQGQNFPVSVITYAAQLAAYYSKLKGSALVPVCYTFKKYVRKPKGMEPGQVIVDREEVMLVEPKL